MFHMQSTHGSILSTTWLLQALAGATLETLISTEVVQIFSIVYGLNSFEHLVPYFEPIIRLANNHQWSPIAPELHLVFPAMQKVAKNKMQSLFSVTAKRLAPRVNTTYSLLLKKMLKISSPTQFLCYLLPQDSFQ